MTGLTFSHEVTEFLKQREEKSHFVEKLIRESDEFRQFDYEPPHTPPSAKA